MQFQLTALKNFKPLQLKGGIERQYVALMMDVVARGLVMASHVDEEVKHEISGFAAGYVLSMKVFPHTPQFWLQVQADHTLRLLHNYTEKPDLTITFKHMHHAFLVFSFQESTAQAFANDRMIADGELSAAIRLVRCLNRMEALILPKMIAQMAVKNYPQNLDIKTKFNRAAQIYVKVAQSYLQRSNRHG